MPADHSKRKREQGNCGDRKKRSWQSTVLRYSTVLARSSAGSELIAYSLGLQRNQSAVPLGTRGFLISCQNGKERQAAHEAEALLTEVVTALCYGFAAGQQAVKLALGPKRRNMLLF